MGNEILIAEIVRGIGIGFMVMLVVFLAIGWMIDHFCPEGEEIPEVGFVDQKTIDGVCHEQEK